MKCVQSGHSRTLRITDIPGDLQRYGNPTEFTIEVRYVGPSNAENGCMIDNVIMPLIVGALNMSNGGLTIDSMDALRASVRKSWDAAEAVAV